MAAAASNAKDGLFTKRIIAREEGKIPCGMKHWVASTQTLSQVGSPLHQRGSPATGYMACWDCNLGLPEHSIKEKQLWGAIRRGCKAIASVRQS